MASGPACVRAPPAATGLYSLRDVARVVNSGYAPFDGRRYPIFISAVFSPGYDWLVALAGIDSYSTANGQHEVNSWATANRLLAPYQMALLDPYAKAAVSAMAQFDMSSGKRVLMVGHSLGGITAQNLLFYAQTLQVSGLPHTRILTFGSPILTFPRFLQPNTTIDRFPGTDVHYFAARADLVVNGPSGFPLRFQRPPLESDPPVFYRIAADGADPHSSYQTSPDMLAFNPYGDERPGPRLQLDPDQQYRCTTAGDEAARPIQFGGSGLDQRPPNCALVDFSTMVSDASRVRASLTTAAQRRQGNVAVAYLQVPGLRCFLAASSQVDAPTPEQQQGLGLVGAATGFYRTRPVPTPDGGERPAEDDTENKILDAIGRGVNMDAQRVGVIQLFTERRPCVSCDQVIADFSRKQPHIAVMVLDYAGNVVSR
jgi:hypothetical protein